MNRCAGPSAGTYASAIEPGIAQGVRCGWLERDGARVRPSARGFDFLSDLQGLFLPDG